MRVIIERCCGLDVHQETVVACLLIGAPGDRPTKEVRTFRTVTRDLEVLRDWLAAAGVTHVGMESTGVYWRPVYAVLEGHFDLIVGNARHIRNVPGRKTDVKDAEWVADLVRHGLIAKSFVPPRPLREMRELLRYRRPAEERPRPKGQCPPPHDPGRRRNLRREDQGQLPQRQIPPSRQRAAVPRPRRSLSRPDRSNPHRRKPEAPA